MTDIDTNPTLTGAARRALRKALAGPHPSSVGVVYGQLATDVTVDALEIAHVAFGDMTITMQVPYREFLRVARSSLA